MASILKVNELKDAGGNAIITSNGSGAVTYSGVDLNGTELILDADADTSITADTDDQVDIKIGGTDAFRITGTALTGNAVATIGATGTASTLAGIPFFSDTSNGSIYTHNVSGTDSTAEGNAAYGLLALDAITTGDYNTAIGYQALSANNTGYSNVALGQAALLANTEGYENISLGKSSLLSNTTGDRNIAIGVRANDLADTESHNLAIGYEAMTGAVAGGEYNVAVGNYTLDALTSGDYNIAVGYSAGSAVTTGGENTLMGRSAGAGITIGSYNVAIGSEALDAVVVERQCTAVGTYALTNHRTSSSSVNDTGNTAVGYAAGDLITTGSGNVIIGAATDPSGNNGENQIVIGNTFNGNGDNKVNFGSGLGYIWNSYTQNATWTQVSDERTKKNIETDTLGLDFINELRPVTFNWRKNAELDSTFKESLLNKHIDKDDSATIHGLIAQEVKAAMDKVGNSTFNGWEDTVDGQAVSREMFITPLIKAVQELSAKVKALEEA